MSISENMKRILDQENDLAQNSSLDSSEPLLAEENSRLTVYPLKHQSIWEMYKKQQAAFCQGFSQGQIASFPLLFP